MKGQFDYNFESKGFTENLELNEINYNCTECPSSIEILSIKENECTIEFKCIKNNHKQKMLIKDYINKMKEFNNNEINNDKCTIHNIKYECYCNICNIHLCKECLKLRNHISHLKVNIIEVQPNKKEINIVEDIIKNYEIRIENLEKEKLNKTKEMNNKLKEYKNKLKEKNEIKFKENKSSMENELKLNKDKYLLDKENLRNNYENEIKEIYYNYKNNENKKLFNDRCIINKNMFESKNNSFRTKTQIESFIKFNIIFFFAFSMSSKMISIY